MPSGKRAFSEMTLPTTIQLPPLPPRRSSAPEATTPSPITPPPTLIEALEARTPSSAYSFDSFQWSDGSASPIQDLRWVNALDDAVNRAVEYRTTTTKDVWRQLLEETLDAWFVNRVDVVKTKCDKALAAKNKEVSYFIKLCFQTLDWWVVLGDKKAVLLFLADVVEAAQADKTHDPTDRDAAEFLLQVTCVAVQLRDSYMKEELAACLGMPRPFIKKE